MAIKHIQGSQTEAIDEEESKPIHFQGSRVLQNKMDIVLDLHEERVIETTRETSLREVL